MPPSADNADGIGNFESPTDIGAAGRAVSVLILAIARHGICYGCLFVAGQIYTDAKAGEHFKSSAQGMITLATYGVGMLIGFSVAGRISDRSAANNLRYRAAERLGLWRFLSRGNRAQTGEREINQMSRDLRCGLGRDIQMGQQPLQLAPIDQ